MHQMNQISHKPKAGVMGWPISHSLSPRLHGFWLQTYGIDGSYEPIAVLPADLTTALRGLSAQGLRGVNLTVPHKEAACAIVDILDPVAGRIGAVNLVTVAENGSLTGRNTDAYGFAQNLLSSGFTPNHGTALVIGAGGACRAVIAALIDMGFSSIRIANRSRDRAEKLAHDFHTPACAVTVVPDAAAAMSDASLLVNTTSLGMTGQPPLALSLDALPLSATVADIVYAPLETDLLRRARLRGNAAIDGLGMLLHQARPSFQAFFGLNPEVTDALRSFVLAGRT
jgi:shikimate dehydrogenase